MQIEILKNKMSVCKLKSIDFINLNEDFIFFSKTDKEISLVCESSKVPSDILKKEDNWRLMRIVGELDFSLVGIMASISLILAKNNISIFVVSTYDTDYILVKSEFLEKAVLALSSEGYDIID